MEVGIQRISHMDEQFVIQEAASAGLQGMDHLIRLLTHHRQNQNQNQLDCSEITEFTVAKFKKVISVLNRTGHARFRRAPVSYSISSFSSSPESTSCSDPSPVEVLPVPMKAPSKSLTIDFSKPNLMNMNTSLKPINNNYNEVMPVSTKVLNSQSVSLSTTTASSSFMSSITGDFGGEGSVSNGKLGTLLFAAAPAPAAVAPVVSSGKPPLASTTKKRCHEHDQSENVYGGGDNCHCSKRRKSKVKNTVRVPSISSKVSDIPSDECSWRKYGQKPIKGSPYPRGYYRCSSMRGCPAKKHVERDPNDPTMLIVTYEDVHCHSQSTSHGNMVIDAGSVDV